MPVVHRSTSVSTWGWHISSMVSGERTSASGAAMNADQRARSRAVLARPPTADIAFVARTGSGRGTSWNGGTK